MWFVRGTNEKSKSELQAGGQSRAWRTSSVLRYFHFQIYALGYGGRFRMSRKAELFHFENEFLKVVHDCGLSVCGSFVDSGGIFRKNYKRKTHNGDLVFSYGVYFSSSHNLFVRSSVGLNDYLVISLLNELSPTLATELSSPYATMGWGIADTGAQGFEPSPSRPGADFLVPENSMVLAIERLRELVPLWLSEVEQYLWKRPIYDFYRFDDRIDKIEGRWREMLAIMKLLRGERFVANQLLLDLVAEAAGRRPEEGNESDLVVYGRRKDKKELDFQKKLVACISKADGNGIFGARSLFSQFRERIYERQLREVASGSDDVKDDILDPENSNS